MKYWSLEKLFTEATLKPGSGGGGVWNWKPGLPMSEGRFFLTIDFSPPVMFMKPKKGAILFNGYFNVSQTQYPRHCQTWFKWTLHHIYSQKILLHNIFWREGGRRGSCWVNISVSLILIFSRCFWHAFWKDKWKNEWISQLIVV